MYDRPFTKIIVGSRIGAAQLEAVRGKILGPRDYDLRMTGPTIVKRADGKLLVIYLPRAIPEPIMEAAYDTLHSLRTHVTRNRGISSGGLRLPTFANSTRTIAPNVSSALVGGFDPTGDKQYCRLTAWTGANLDKYAELFPLFQVIDDHFREQVPDRYRVQREYIERTHPDWHIGGTVFTTITVNNSYPTGVHTDKGDLDQGFSTLAVMRYGSYSGGVFTFPEYRLAVDLQHGDLLLMDAHEWHGNTFMQCNVCGEGMGSPLFYPSHETCGAERISVVSYFRTKMTACGSTKDEVQRAYAWAEKRAAAGLPVDPDADDDELVQAMQVDEMAIESQGG